MGTSYCPHEQLSEIKVNIDANPKEAVKSIQSPNALEEVLEAVGAGEVAMRIVGKLMQVASIAGVEGSADETITPDGKVAKCAILPWESRKKLVLSDISCKLNRVRRFLERDIGYVLLDDAAPSNHGGIGLRAVVPREQQKPGLVAPNAQDRERDEGKIQDMVMFRPDMARFAKYPDDLVLVLRFMDTLEGVATRAKGETTCKTILQGVRLMHSCKYGYTDIVLTLAYTSIYFRETVDQINQNMCDYEAAHVCALLMFLAHSFILDETCPLKFWQQSIFKHYCNLKILDMALFRLFRLLNFQLRISKEDEQRALSILLRDEASEQDMDLITH